MNLQRRILLAIKKGAGSFSSLFIYLEFIKNLLIMTAMLFFSYLSKKVF